jgi:1-deoxy-D-xylulose-5-phosphate reductoisomerase
MTTRRLIILGSTGSIGTQTLEVVEHLNALHDAGRSDVRYRVVGLAAGRNVPRLLEQAARFDVPRVAIADGDAVSGAPAGLRVDRGPDAAERLVRETECDVVLAAMVGAAGLPATLAAVEAGRDVALANKETLVAAGGLVVPGAKRTGAHLLPVDSEHGGVWQCLCGHSGPVCPPMVADVKRLVLTASGGPFREWTRERIEAATPEEALRHPTWSMGPKVTIDSASLMNKALEIIEAHWLFGVPVDRIEALIHPQSIVHAFVEFVDGTLLAQLAAPDMRAPIQHALTWPGRAPGLANPLDVLTLRDLRFEAPDLSRFPALAFAGEAIRRGGTAGAVLNAANEAAVQAFLAGRLPFGGISRLVAHAMEKVPVRPLTSLADCLDADAEARRRVEEACATHAVRHASFHTPT